ncbi:MAG: PLDc N-terminal domain-containing protein [Bernardetiaceae bacterium]|nr:PLDc N-terminal domain-containing protein [Bernardetiaceae bacterium]
MILELISMGYLGFIFSTIGSIFSLIWFLLTIYGLYTLWTSPSTAMIGKIGWTLVMLFAPYIGVAAYYIFGRS